MADKPKTIISAPTPEQLQALQASQSVQPASSVPPAVQAQISSSNTQKATDPSKVSPEAMQKNTPLAPTQDLGFKNAQDAYNKGYRLGPGWTWDPITGKPVPSDKNTINVPGVSPVPQFEPLPGYDPNAKIGTGAGTSIAPLQQQPTGANMPAQPTDMGGPSAPTSPLARTALMLSNMNNPNFLSNYNIQPDLLDSMGVAMQKAGKVWGGGNENAKTKYRQGLDMALASQEAANKTYAENLSQGNLMQNKYNIDVAEAENILPMQVKAEIEKQTGIAWGTLSPDLKKIYAQAYVNLMNSKQDVAQGLTDPFTLALKMGAPK